MSYRKNYKNIPKTYDKSDKRPPLYSKWLGPNGEIETRCRCATCGMSVHKGQEKCERCYQALDWGLENDK